jgi:trk system potassium uptake protein TrkH
MVLLAVFVGFYYNEIQATTGLLLTSVVFFCTGFVLNALCERKELDFKTSCTLVAVVFFLLGLIGSIPYMYLNVFPSESKTESFLNSFFESVSGFTTTGFSFISNIDSQPKSLIFYRSLTQWIGGIGIVFIILAFFYPENILDNLSKPLNFEKAGSTLKRTYFGVLTIYTVYAVIFVFIFHVLGFDLITSASLTFSSISTGGFSPTVNAEKIFSYPTNIVVMVLMLIGATSFAIHYKIFSGKFKGAPYIELLVFILIIIFGILLVGCFTNLDFLTSAFHIVSASTTTGHSFIEIKSLNSSVKLLMTFLMFIGGSYFSTAGGIKVMRFISFLKSIPWAIKNLITGKLEDFSCSWRKFSHPEIFAYLAFILIAVLLISVATFIFVLHGFSLEDSLFDVTSAFATTGLTTNVTSILLAPHLKIILILLMILGRIEILPLLVALFPKSK